MTDEFLTLPPPWKVFPGITAEEFGHYTTQGATEAYFEQVFRPFWSELTPSERQRYLDRWCATAAWRHALDALLTPDPDLDLAADQAEYEERERRRREQRPAQRSWWRRWRDRR